MKIYPLENFSSLHETTIIEQLGWNFYSPFMKFFIQYSFNLHTPLMFHPEASLILDTKDANAASSFSNRSFCITNLTRWRLDISPYKSFENYLENLIRWHFCNYKKSKKNFFEYGCRISFIENDWSEYAEEVYSLYEKVAKHYKHTLYNLSFFQEISKRVDYKLLCAWYEKKMIGVFVLQEEVPTLHSICAGLDYKHTSPSFAYSWMHYALFDYAIKAKKYKNIDVGFNCDEAKKTIGFHPIRSRMDVYCTGKIMHALLKACSHFFSGTITSKAKLRFKWNNKV